MSILSKLFGKHQADDGSRVGGMEDFMYLIRVYYQSVIASRLGITNLSVLPDLRVFKQTLHVPTVNNKLGLGEKNRCQKMLEELYKMSDTFFKDIDDSIKRNCHKPNDVRDYMYLFQGFSQELLMVLSNTMQWKLRIPSVFKKTIYSVIKQGVDDILTKENWKDAGVRKSVYNVRVYQKRLGYSSDWMTEYVYHIILLAKKEPKPKDTEDKKEK